MRVARLTNEQDGPHNQRKSYASSTICRTTVYLCHIEGELNEPMRAGP